MKTTVIHHSADFDGLFCREIARKFLPDAELIGWDYGDSKLAMPAEGTVYILDLCPDCFADPGMVVERFASQIVWVDHHKSAIEKYPVWLDGYRIDGVAACRLAWQWFAIAEHNAQHQTNEQLQIPLPSKLDFIDRIVPEPLAVRLAGEYDIWDKRDPDAELFQHGLRSCNLDDLWPWLLKMDERLPVSEIEKLMDVGHAKDLLRPDGTTPNPTVLNLLEKGRGIQYAQTAQNESIIKAIGFDLVWEGLHFLACNHARYNSHLFTAGLRPEHDACFGFKYSNGKWEVSLYHAPGKEHHDLSQIAVKYGGGGHRGACGFRIAKLPFMP